MTENYCWLCGRNGKGDPLESHHLWGGALRKKSEKYGLTVKLCGCRCHRLGPNAVHQSRETRLMLQQYGQKKVMTEQGWTTEQFISEFGQNFLDL